MSNFNFEHHIEDALNVKWKLGSKELDYDHNISFVVVYDYMHLDTNCKYSFNNENITKEEYNLYFQRVKELSSKNVSILLDNKSKNHFHQVDNPTKELKEMIKKLFKKDYDFASFPTIFQLSLYDIEKIERPFDSARIFFFIGRLGFLYMLFFDREHKFYSKIGKL